MRRSQHLTVSIKVGLVLILFGVQAVFAPPATAQPQTLTGWFTMTVVDYPPESGRAPETTYTLTEDSGERHELLIDIELMQPLGGPVALNRKRVTVMGEWEEVGPAAIEQFRVHAIELAASPSTALQGRTLSLDSFLEEPPAPRLEQFVNRLNRGRGFKQACSCGKLLAEDGKRGAADGPSVFPRLAGSCD